MVKSELFECTTSFFKCLKKQEKSKENKEYAKPNKIYTYIDQYVRRNLYIIASEKHI